MSSQAQLMDPQSPSAHTQKHLLYSTHLLHFIWRHTCFISSGVHSALLTPQQAVCSSNAMLLAVLSLAHLASSPTSSACRQTAVLKQHLNIFHTKPHSASTPLYLSLPLVPCAVPLFRCKGSSGAEGPRAHPVRGQHINIRLLRRLQRSVFAAVRGQAAVIQQTQDSPSYAAHAVAVIKLPPAARQPQSLARRSWPRLKYLHAGRQARISSINLLVQRQQMYTACGHCGQAARADDQIVHAPGLWLECLYAERIQQELRANGETWALYRLPCALHSSLHTKTTYEDGKQQINAHDTRSARQKKPRDCMGQVYVKKCAVPKAKPT